MFVDHSGYHDTCFDPKALKRTVNRVVKELRKLKRKLKFDAIAFRGASGAGVAYPVSMLTGYPLIYVRKEKSHHGSDIEGPSGHEVLKYIILDDFIDTGATVKAIIKKIFKETPYDDKPAQCVGICLYDYGNKDHFYYQKKKIPVFDLNR